MKKKKLETENTELHFELLTWKIKKYIYLLDLELIKTDDVF